MADVEVTYNNTKIVELSESGTKTLKTAGKYLEGDIVLEYEKPSGGDSDFKGFLFPFQQSMECIAGNGIATVDYEEKYAYLKDSGSSSTYENNREWYGLKCIPNWEDYSCRLKCITRDTIGDCWTLDFFCDWYNKTIDCYFHVYFADFVFVRKKTELVRLGVGTTNNVGLQSHTYSPTAHMAFVYTGEELRIFENGALVDTKTLTLESNPQELMLYWQKISASSQSTTGTCISNLRLVPSVLGTADSFPVPTILYTGDETL